MKNSAIKTRFEGFTLIEILISLVITGMLLAAVAVALQAAVVNYQENEKVFKGTNTARQALIRMINQIRTGYVDPNNITNEQECIVSCSDGSLEKYHYDSAADKLYLYDYDTSSDYLLCDNVTALAFKKDNNTSSGDVKSVRISITVSQNGSEQTLAAAALVRKVLER